MDAVGATARGRLAAALVAARARLRRPELEVQLAEGVSPWQSDELLWLAARLGALPERRRLASALAGLVALAGTFRPAAPYRHVRREHVLALRRPLLALSRRLADPAPVDVAVVARLTLLVFDASSPAYVGDTPAGELAEVIEDCLRSLGEELSWPTS